MDLSYSLKEKTQIFSEEVRASLSSLKEALDFVKKQSSNDEYTDNYQYNLTQLNNKIKTGKVVIASSSTNNKKAFIPSYDKNDINYKQALFSV